MVAFITSTASLSNAFSQTTNVTQTTDSTKTTRIKVKGINCSMDLKTISANVEKLKGVNSCKTIKQGVTATFEVKFNPAMVSEKEIYAAIENTGGCENPDERPYKVKQ